MTTPPTRPARQEAEPASGEITEVAPGVLRLQLPIPLPGLRHVNCYALEDERGWTVVDPGMPGPWSWRPLEQRCQAAGFHIKNVHTVVVTHSHPDHFGGAGRLRQVAGAEVVSSSMFRLWWDPADEQDSSGDGAELTDNLSVDGDTGTDAEAGAATDTDGRDRSGPGPTTPRARRPWNERTPWGGSRPLPPRKMRLAMRALGPFRQRLFPTPRPSVRLDDADTIRLGRRDWVAVHTPGHTPDHLCLFQPDDGILLAGDHVLPTITPHISGLDAGPDPLAAFVGSLDKVTELPGVQYVLPAHGHPFADLAGRVEDIKRHHDERLERLRGYLADMGEGSVMELMQRLFRPRSWGGMAESETYAHLEHLRLAADVARRDGAEGTYIYSLR